MSETAIKVEHVSKVYKLYDKPSDRLRDAFGLARNKTIREHFALRDVDFEVQKGEAVGLIGTNGSGKSTILKIITGVLYPTAGEVTVNGRISALLELGSGFNMEYTGIENVYLNGTLIGFTKEEIDEKLNDILDFADIGDFVNQPVKTYSSGMFVRLAFAVAINIEPEILIVDEALSVGDVFFQAKCYHKFEEFKKQGKTLLFVSHDLSSVAKYCDRVVLLNQGDKLGEGSPKKMIDIYKRLLVNQYSEEEAETTSGETDAAKASEALLWKNQMAVNPDIVEYSNGAAAIIDYGVADHQDMVTSAIMKNKEFTIMFKVEFREAVSNPIFAITIKDIKGTEITGTNTMVENIDTGTVNPGEVRTVRFTQNMNLQAGNYLVSLGCTGYQNGEFVVYHRLYDIFNLTVIAKKNTVGFYDMNSDIVIE